MNTNKEYLLDIGTVINNKWLIVEFIAKGGMGEVYRAHQLNLKRDVAIKVISKEWLYDISSDEEERKNAILRFKREVLNMAQIRHPNIIQIYDFDKATIEIDGQQREIEYIAIEYIPGKTLRDTMSEEGFYFSEEKVVDWIKTFFVPILDAVDAIHNTGIIHRDIKPENILLDNDIPKIADFGIARCYKFPSITCSIEIKGTPVYMAPEQFTEFKNVDQTVDIYALGKILYEVIEGKLSEKGPFFNQVELKNNSSPFFQDINKIIKKATEKNPGDRFKSIGEFKKSIDYILDKYQKEKSNLNIKKDGSYITISKKFAYVFSLVLLIILSLTMSFFYYSKNRHLKEHVGSKKNVNNNYYYPVKLPLTVISKDRSVLQLIPGSTFYVPKNFDNKINGKVKIKPFYMDKTPITNQQYVTFLNKIKKDLVIQQNAVKRDGKIYIYLGQAYQSYEPIVFENGEFRVKHPGHAACPVVRVTGYGAIAYATFYNKRLPTKFEWLYVASEGKFSINPDKLYSFPKNFFESVKMPYPVLLFKENFFGIKGMNINLGSWCLISYNSKNKNEDLVIMGGFGFGEKDDILLPVERKPWEAFEEVSFRCVKDIQ